MDFALLLFLVKMCPKYCRNMNAMWSEMSVGAREEYKEYFIRYHNTVAKTGFTGKRVKPVTVLPSSVVKAKRIPLDSAPKTFIPLYQTFI